jgi:uncharacterized SAM-binding protein YcdF (DUF218 family)
MQEVSKMKNSSSSAITVHILAACSFAYGIFIMAAGSGSFFFLFWIVLALIAEGFLFCMKKNLFIHIPLWIRRICLTVASLLLALFLFLEIRIVSDFHPAIAEPQDYLIVLGAQVYNGRVSTILRHRLDAAYDYLAQNPETKVIVTGGQGFNEPYPEAEGMAAYLMDRGISEERILKEDQADNTVQNIEYSFAMIDPENDRICIVTNQFHVHRAMLLAKKAGAKHLSGIGAPSDPLYLLNNMVRESAALIKDWLIGRI